VKEQLKFTAKRKVDHFCDKIAFSLELLPTSFWLKYFKNVYKQIINHAFSRAYRQWLLKCTTYKKSYNRIKYPMAEITLFFIFDTMFKVFFSSQL